MSNADASLATLERKARVKFRDRGLLWQSLVHKSYVNERLEQPSINNERLEFLGDAVLGAVAAQVLYEAYPNAPEGDLTVLRASLVRQSTLAEWARTLDLGTYMLLGRGEALGGGRERETLLSRTFEALVGAMFLDRGYRCVERFLRRFLVAGPDVSAEGKPSLDAKSRLQQVSQARYDITPEYDVVEVSGPGHGPTFTIEVSAGPFIRALGRGRTKQLAQQAAAQAALEQIDQTIGEADGEPLLVAKGSERDGEPPAKRARKANGSSERARPKADSLSEGSRRGGDRLSAETVQ